jgi:AraC-like DNA-binding protein
MKKLTEDNLIETCVFSTEHPELAAQGIWRIGYTTVSKSHDRPSTARDERFGHVHVTLAGSAQVLTGNGWHDLRPGQAYVCPPGESWRWRSTAGKAPWKVMFVRLLAKPDLPLHYAGSDPYVVDQCRKDDLAWAYRRLCMESSSEARPTVMHHLGALCHFHCREIVSGENAATNLQDLWSEVLADLSYRWTVDRLAERSGMGREALRMKCVAATGRSPMKHLNHLRMQHACHLLLDQDLTLDEVAEAVGYSTAFSFSKAFLAHTGTRPSTYRQKHQ